MKNFNMITTIHNLWVNRFRSALSDLNEPELPKDIVLSATEKLRESTVEKLQYTAELAREMNEFTLADEIQTRAAKLHIETLTPELL